MCVCVCVRVCVRVRVCACVHSYRALGMLCYFMMIAVIIFSSLVYLLERGHYFYCTHAAAAEARYDGPISPCYVVDDATRMSGPARKGSRWAGTVEARRCLRQREGGEGGGGSGRGCDA